MVPVAYQVCAECFPLDLMKILTPIDGRSWAQNLVPKHCVAEDEVTVEFQKNEVYLFAGRKSLLIVGSSSRRDRYTALLPCCHVRQCKPSLYTVKFTDLVQAFVWLRPVAEWLLENFVTVNCKVCTSDA